MMIQFKQVTKRYESGLEALSQVSFELDRGEMVFLTGHSGAGKSTFLKLIALLEQPSAGQIIVDGQLLNHIHKRRDIAKHRMNIGVMFQTPYLLQDRSVFENVALPLLIRGESLPTITKRAHAALDLVGLLKKEKCLPLECSGGEQQRVGLARALVHKPPLLLADEPTGNLDPILSMEMMQLFEQFNQVGVSVIVATHDLALIAGMKYRMVSLKRGKIC